MVGLTPKPWKYGIRRDGSMWLSLGNPRIGQHRQGDLIATKADANLICTAPDLLGALEDCVALLEVIKEHWIDYDHVFSAGVSDAKAVIAKAKGGAE